MCGKVFVWKCLPVEISVWNFTSIMYVTVSGDYYTCTCTVITISIMHIIMAHWQSRLGILNGPHTYWTDKVDIECTSVARSHSPR